MNLLPLAVLLLAQDPGWTVRADSDAMGGSVRLQAQSPDERFRLSVGAFGRLSWPIGSVEDQDEQIVGNLVVVPDHLRYGDLFDPGFGLALEASVALFQPGSGRETDGFGAGLYASLQIDTYEGSAVSEGSAFIDPDDLDMAAAFVGIVVTTDLGGGGYGQGHLGAGVVRYDTVNAEVSLNAGGSEVQELFEESRQFAAEVRYRLNLRFGPLALVGGLGLRVMGGLDEGESALGDLLHTHAFWTFDADLGLELGF